MNYKGVIIEESLGDKSVLNQVQTIDTQVENVTSEHQTPWLSQWTLHTVEISEKYIEKFTESISHSFDSNHPNWYADFKSKDYHYIVFSNKIFKVDLQKPLLYLEAKKYGMSIGIPEYQVNFAPDDKIWAR